MAPGRISCAYCGGDHTTAAGVRACFERRKAAAGRASGAPRPVLWKAMAAEEMRANPTPTEDLLTGALRRRLMLSVEPQANILGWTVDVYIPAARLVIEIDGSSHVGREPEDGRRDEQMRAERFIVVRVSASDVLRDVDSVVRSIEARIPPGANEEQQRLDEEVTLLRREEIARRAADRLQAQSGAAQPRRTVRAMAYPYVCTSCSNFFRTAERPMPDCRRCGSSRHVKVACRCGAVALKGTYRCADCEVVQDAAGPQARAYTGQRPHHAKRGRKL